MKHSKVVPTTLGLAAAALLAACGGSASSSSSSTASAPPAAGASGGSAASGSGSAAGVAKAGASFAVGQAATVNYTPASAISGPPAAKLLVTVESIEKGSLDDFKGVDLDASQKAGLPQYVKVKITNRGPKSVVGDAVAADVQGIDNTGNTAQSITFIGDFPRCNDVSTQKPVAPGSSLETCLTFLVPGGISKVAYTGTEDYISSPVTWK